MPIDDISLTNAVAFAVAAADSSQSRLILTPNTDHFLRWRSEQRFRDIYETASLITCDGAALQILARLESGLHLRRITGVDLFQALANAAGTASVPLVLIGGAPGIAEEAARRLVAETPGTRVTLALAPSEAQVHDDEWIASLHDQLLGHESKIVALCLGSPKQERLYMELQKRADTGGVFLCVGATIDFLAGSKRRAPLLLQRLGLEWAFRLLQEPRRLWRRYLIDDIQIFRYFFLAATRRLLVLLRSLNLHRR